MGLIQSTPAGSSGCRPGTEPFVIDVSGAHSIANQAPAPLEAWRFDVLAIERHWAPQPVPFDVGRRPVDLDRDLEVPGTVPVVAIPQRSILAIVPPIQAAILRTFLRANWGASAG